MKTKQLKCDLFTELTAARLGYPSGAIMAVLLAMLLLVAVVLGAACNAGRWLSRLWGH